MRDVGYLCANFGLPRPLWSRLRPDVRDRQTDVRRHTDVRQKHRLMPPPIRGGGIIRGSEVSQVKLSNCFGRLEKLVLPSIYDTSLSYLMV